MSARHWFGLRLERVRLRTMLTVERAAPQPREAALARLAADLTELDRELAAGPPSPPEQHLQRAFGLGADELDLLWTAVAVASDPRVLPHAVVLGGSEARRGATLALHALIAGLDGARARDLALAMGPDHPLMRHHVLSSGDDVTGVAGSLVVCHRVATFLAGVDRPDPAVAAIGGPVDVPAELVWSAEQATARDRVAQQLAAADPAVLILEGPAGVGRRTMVASVARAIAIDARRLPGGLAALDAALIALFRECLLVGALPVIANIDDLIDSETTATARIRALGRALDRHAGPVVLTTSMPGMELGLQRRMLRIAVPAPETATRRALWERGIGAPSLGDQLDPIAMRYRLGAGGIASAVATARALAEARAEPLAVADLVGGVRNDIAERLGGVAQRIEVRQSWDDLVLGSDTLDQVRGLAARVRLSHQVLERWGFSSKLPRGLGVAALFTGPPGTGKTMVAGLIARELDLELYQVDLSKVISKWVGETEKQLARTFEAAEAGHALLLFDEADSLFAKRTEVKGSNDRYANLEVNYLLQRIEAFGGITILTTNMDTSIDPALRRRLAAHVTFWPPDDSERQVLWRRMLPGDAPVDPKIDFESLSLGYPDMTGANIRNAVIAAAFLAASENSKITERHLERAANGEYRSMGRVLDSR